MLESRKSQPFENPKEKHRGKRTAFGIGASITFAIAYITGTLTSPPAHAATSEAGNAAMAKPVKDSIGASAVKAANKANAVNESVKWLTVNRAAKTVTLKLIAGATADNGGMNFDGYSGGAMNVEIPQGWTVRVSFQNHSGMMTHSAMVVPYSQRTQVAGFTAAFPGASTPSSNQGTHSGVTQSFHFKANKIGTFALVCALPGHSAGGMWDKVTVSNKLKAPAVMVTESSQSSGDAW